MFLFHTLAEFFTNQKCEMKGFPADDLNGKIINKNSNPPSSNYSLLHTFGYPKSCRFFL